MSEDKTAPRPGCRCDVCDWMRRRIERDKELESNYRKYLAGELVAKDGKE